MEKDKSGNVHDAHHKSPLLQSGLSATVWGRISRVEMLMQIAHIVSKRGTCAKLRVGAVISRDSRPISIGYCGAPSGQPHCHPDICNLLDPCIRTVHAEQNAIAFAARAGISVDRCDLFVTDSPCLECAKLIVNSGILRVYFDREYRDPRGVNFLHDAGLIVGQWQLIEKFGGLPLPR